MNITVALACWVIGIFGILHANKLADDPANSERTGASALGAMAFLITALLATAITLGVIFA